MGLDLVQISFEELVGLKCSNKLPSHTWLRVNMVNCDVPKDWYPQGVRWNSREGFPCGWPTILRNQVALCYSCQVRVGKIW